MGFRYCVVARGVIVDNAIVDGWAEKEREAVNALPS